MERKLLFLVGAGRSGTTLLYKILSLHKDVGFISNYDTRLPAWAAPSLLVRLIRHSTQLKLASWFGAGGNAYLRNRPWLKKLVPTPAEGENVYTACGLPLFPTTGEQLSAEVAQGLRKRFERMAVLTGCRVFVTKRTANNRRIALLLEAFPDAVFLNLIRDGRDVAYSLSKVHWWNQSTVFWAGLTPPELERQGMHPLDVCARNWTEEVNVAREGLAMVPQGRKIELRYEALLEHPIDELRRVSEWLGLEFSDDFRAAIESLQLSRSQPKWRNEWTEHDLNRVLAKQEQLLRTLAYLQ